MTNSKAVTQVEFQNSRSGFTAVAILLFISSSFSLDRAATADLNRHLDHVSFHKIERPNEGLPVKTFQIRFSSAYKNVSVSSSGEFERERNERDFNSSTTSTLESDLVSTTNTTTTPKSDTKTTPTPNAYDYNGDLGKKTMFYALIAWGGFLIVVCCYICFYKFCLSKLGRNWEWLDDSESIYQVEMPLPHSTNTAPADQDSNTNFGIS